MELLSLEGKVAVVTGGGRGIGAASARRLAEAGARVALLDLEPGEGEDPVETVREIRSEMLLNIPIFCFGGDAAARDAARLARADRFFERAEIVARLPALCESFAW
jgi:NAD(P)-dependent dehydrogenase (short-subunit alcohol dehydrogenase family)